MTIQEFSDQFDVLYNNITSNQAPGLDEYEKSLFLTKAEKEIVKNYFTANSKGNTIGQGFDDSAKRQADFSVLMRTAVCTEVTLTPDTTISQYVEYDCVDGQTDEHRTLLSGIHFSEDLPDGTYSVTVESGSDPFIMYMNPDTEQLERVTVSGWPFTHSGGITIVTHAINLNTSKIDYRSKVYAFPSDVYIAINESLVTSKGEYLQVIPLRFDEYTRLMLKPFKRPLKHQAWRLMNTGQVIDSKASRMVEIIANSWNENDITQYSIRYVRVPRPIIVAPLGSLSIDGESQESSACELDPILHEDVLQRAVELAKVAWTATGQDNVQLEFEAGKRSE